ncbi:MAG: ribbon-helix-helix protein, CopG family [Bacteroidales bacterium]|nr:ribbon-helix-helix protein, CopG family [Bacteroidales bacterium]
MRAGNTVVISVSLPDRLAEVLEQVCEEHDFNRSQFIASAVKDRLDALGVKVREK